MITPIKEITWKRNGTNVRKLFFQIGQIELSDIFPSQRNKQALLSANDLARRKRSRSTPFANSRTYCLSVRRWKSQTGVETTKRPKLDFPYRFHSRKIRYSTEGAIRTELSTSKARSPWPPSSSSSSWLPHDETRRGATRRGTASRRRLYERT